MATSMSPRDGGQYTCFAVVAVLGSQPFDTIQMVPSRERRAAGRAVALANCGPLVPECSLHAIGTVPAMAPIACCGALPPRAS